MAESSIHRSMKAQVRTELERDSYSVVEEPVYPPGDRLRWTSYRPDLLGYRGSEEGEEVVLVECETRPSMRRLEVKRDSSVSFQSRLARPGSVRRILAVPRGRLEAIDLRVRQRWEVWVLGDGGQVRKIPALGGHSES